MVVISRGMWLWTLFAAMIKYKSTNFTLELRGQIEDAGVATQKAFANLRRIVYMETGEGPPAMSMPSNDEVFSDKSKDKDKALSSEVLIMQPIFRFFQLLCENHNLELQVSGPCLGGFCWLLMMFISAALLSTVSNGVNLQCSDIVRDIQPIKYHSKSLRILIGRLVGVCTQDRNGLVKQKPTAVFGEVT